MPKVIMVVEDDPDIRDVIATTLADHGYDVIAVANGREALDQLRAAPRRPAWILLDLAMPVMDGWEFRAAQQLDPSLADVPVLVLSAQLDVHAAAERLAAAAWLRKPVDLRAMLRIVAQTAA